MQKSLVITGAALGFLALGALGLIVVQKGAIMAQQTQSQVHAPEGNSGACTCDWVCWAMMAPFCTTIKPRAPRARKPSAAPVITSDFCMALSRQPQPPLANQR